MEWEPWAAATLHTDKIEKATYVYSDMSWQKTMKTSKRWWRASHSEKSFPSYIYCTPLVGQHRDIYSCHCGSWRQGAFILTQKHTQKYEPDMATCSCGRNNFIGVDIWHLFIWRNVIMVKHNLAALQIITLDFISTLKFNTFFCSFIVLWNLNACGSSSHVRIACSSALHATKTTPCPREWHYNARLCVFVSIRDRNRGIDVLIEPCRQVPLHIRPKLQLLHGNMLSIHPHYCRLKGKHA